MRIVADKALAVLIRTMKHEALFGRMAIRTQLASRSEQSDGCFVFCRCDAVAVLTTQPHCRMDEPAFFLPRMASQAGLSLDFIWFNEGMLYRFFSKCSER
jgi:hypothetical protein